MATSTLRFDADWAETHVLADGRRVRYRLLRPDDRAKIVEGLSRLSERSRYLRFFTEKPKLTEAELAYLTEVDQVDHVAIGVALMGPDGDDDEGPGVGIGRFVRLVDEPEIADPAIAVVDELHGNGIGRQLMTYLIGAAAERGIRAFRTELLAVNRPMKELLSELSPQTIFRPDGAIVLADFPLPNAEAALVVAEAPQFAPLRQALRLAAMQGLELFGVRLVDYIDPERITARLQRWARRLRGQDRPEGHGD
jgi:GNAT superfamily N-acetyltransferase